jgi:hypothetical protein
MLLKVVSTSLLLVHLMVRWQTSHSERFKAIFGLDIGGTLVFKPNRNGYIKWCLFSSTIKLVNRMPWVENISTCHIVTINRSFNVLSCCINAFYVNTM